MTSALERPLMFEEPATPTFRKSPAATVALDADSRPGIFRSVSGEPKIAPRLVARVFVVFIAIFLNHITIAQEETGHSGLPPGVVARLGTHRFVHHGRLQTLSFSPDGTAIFAVTEDEACLWDVQKGNRRVEFEIQPGRPATIMCGGMSHDWKTAILAENGPLLYVFDVATGQHKAILRGAKERAYAVALSADGRMAASGDANEVILWDTTEAKELRRFPLVRKLIGPHPSLIGALRFSPDNKRLAIATLPVGGEMWIQDIVGKDAPLHLEGATGSDAWFAFSPDGKTLAGSSKEFVSGKQDLPLRVWDVSTGRRLLGMPRVADCGVYSPDGRRLLTASGFTSSGFNEVIIYDASTGKEQHRLSVGHAHINAVAFSPEGRMLATGMDRRIQLWDTATWQEVNPASGHTESVQTLAFAPDGRTIASGGRDGSVILGSWPEG